MKLFCIFVMILNHSLSQYSKQPHGNDFNNVMNSIHSHKINTGFMHKAKNNMLRTWLRKNIDGVNMDNNYNDLGDYYNANPMSYLNTVDAMNQYPEIESRLTETSRSPPNFTGLFFQGLENYESSANPSREEAYPWIARVIHSRSASFPLAGTASCIQPRIFIAAARSVAPLKVMHTSVIYQNHRLPVQAFVLPSNPTKQMWEDIAVIVVQGGIFEWQWATVNIYKGKRTDNTYQWFQEAIVNQQYKAVGYAFEKRIRKNPDLYGEYKLCELPVIVDIDLCQKVYGKSNIKGYNLPCYHSCSFNDFRKVITDKHRNPVCQHYLGTEGGAVINAQTNELLGVSTWGVIFEIIELPVGFAVPNSEAFLEDLECAVRIRDDSSQATNGYYQGLCDKKTLRNFYL